MANPKTIAKKHIEHLHNESRKRLYSDTSLAQRYVNLIRRIAMKFRMRLPREIKKSYCKHCYTVFEPGKNCRVRLQSSKLVYYCFSCKQFTRLPYGKKGKN